MCRIDYFVKVAIDASWKGLHEILRLIYRSLEVPILLFLCMFLQNCGRSCDPSYPLPKA